MVDGIDGGPDAAPTAKPRNDRELRMVPGLTLAGQSVREIAIALYGADAVAAEWTADSAMRTFRRQRIRPAQRLAPQP